MKSFHTSPWQRLFRLLAVVLLSLTASAAWAAVGQFQFVSGNVRIVASDARERPAQKGGDIEEGESIVSSPGATAQLRMKDGGIIAVRQDTRMRIDEYRFNGQEDGSERSFFSLLKGGFRSITGSIGKLHKENYRIQTPSATIGIRGTDSETIHVTSADERLPEVPAGTYNKVNVGATVMNGTLVSPNQVGFAPSLSVSAILLPNIPPIFELPRTPAGSQSKGKDDSASEASPPPSPDERAIAQTSLPPPPEPTSALVGATTATATTYPAPIGYGGVGADISWRSVCQPSGACFTGWLGGSGTMRQEAGSSTTVLLNSDAFPVLLAASDAFGSMQYSSGSASLLDAGQVAVADTTVRWGRYVGADAFVDKTGTRDPLVMNLMWATSVLTLAQAQAALTSATSFNLVSGAGNVSDESNNVYRLTNGSLHVSAGGTGIELNLTTDTVANRSWDLTYRSSSDALSQFYQEQSGPSGLPLDRGSLKLNGTIVPTIVMGHASGVLLGSNATAAVTSFTANAAPSSALPGGAALSGTALLTR